MVCRAWSDTEERGERRSLSKAFGISRVVVGGCRGGAARSSRRQDESQWWRRLGVLTGRDLEALGSSHQFPGRRTSQG